MVNASYICTMVELFGHCMAQSRRLLRRLTLLHASIAMK
jgi:hypothetical protein